MHHIVSFLASLLQLLIEAVFYYASSDCHFAVTHFLAISYVPSPKCNFLCAGKRAAQVLRESFHRTYIRIRNRYPQGRISQHFKQFRQVHCGWGRAGMD